MVRLDARLVERLHRAAEAGRWEVSASAFAAVLEASLERAPGEAQGDPERYLTNLHLKDLALACACSAGHEAAWEHFIREHRPLLYRAADALAPGGAARDIADGLYGELFGLKERGGERQSLFRYFHGRSSLATWVRAVLAQRFVDRVRSERRIDPLSDAESLSVPPSVPDPGQAQNLLVFQKAMAAAVARLSPRDRLRLSSYYAEELSLAQTGRLFGEHESTVSRQLARTRRLVRGDVEEQLLEAGLTGEEIEECFERATEDAGDLDLDQIVRLHEDAPAGQVDAAERKKPEIDRST
jgi:RNA polymerase sigma-70 factor